MRLQTRMVLAVVSTLLAVLACLPKAAIADHQQSSVFQDDQELIYSDTPTVQKTLAELQGLGVEIVRVNVEWANVAPDPLSYTEPSGFNASDPADYPASGWAPYDRLVSLAPLYGIKVEFNLTSPGPLWAMGTHPPTTRAANHWYPSGPDFFQFVYAVGVRYSGGAGDQPDVTDWSIWNEPNQPGWLAPQWAKVHGREVREAPRLYRTLVDYANYGLYFSGHSHDKILIGETAPEGYETPGFYTAITPMPFLRDLYCVTAQERPLRGEAASNEGCPTKGAASGFAKANPLLFQATGYAHHPYFFFHAPAFGGGDPNFAPIADIGRLERFLSSAFRTYGVRRQIPIYYTEYGYQTNPPDPYQVVTPAEQAAYLNQADYMAWRDGRVRSVAQFLLFDAAPNHLYRPSQFDYWDTFQTGLRYQSGGYKPAFFAYRLPIWIPSPTARPGQSTFIWGQVRPADQERSQAVTIEWKGARGSWRKIGTAHTGSYTGYLTTHVRLPGSGYLELAWRSASGIVEHSRAAPVSVS